MRTVVPYLHAKFERSRSCRRDAARKKTRFFVTLTLTLTVPANYFASNAFFCDFNETAKDKSAKLGTLLGSGSPRMAAKRRPSGDADGAGATSTVSLYVLYRNALERFSVRPACRLPRYRK